MFINCTFEDKVGLDLEDKAEQALDDTGRVEVVRGLVSSRAERGLEDDTVTGLVLLSGRV